MSFSIWHLNPVAFCDLLIIAATVASYSNSFSGVFLFDDRLHILDEEKRIESLWPPGELLSRRRPVVDISLALNYRIHGETEQGYHATNLVIHVLAALTLFGLVRRTLSLGVPGDESARHSYDPTANLEATTPRVDGVGSASTIALSMSLLWAVHPLTTQSVTYLVQRAESLMGLFYLLTLYCVVRRATDQRRVFWSLLAVVCCALGMGSKAVMVTAPFVVLLFDRVFLSTSWTSLLGQRKWLYVGLFATWGVLWTTGTGPAVLNPSTPDSNVGFSYHGISSWEYAQTQCGVLLTYLRLALWPHPLCLDYAWPTATTFGGWLLPGIIVLALLYLVVRGFMFRPRLGFIGAWFFLILAPTSSFIPIRDTMFEHRMYLSLAGVIVMTVWLSRSLLRYVAQRFCITSGLERFVALGVTTVSCLSLGLTTLERNKMYHSESEMWHDVLQKQPQSVRAIENYGTALLAEDRTEEALPVLQEAARRNPGSAEAHNGLGFALARFNRYDEALASFQAALRLKPRHKRAMTNVGHIYCDTGRLEECVSYLQNVVRTHPRYLEARLDLGNALLTTGRKQEAIDQYREILAVDPHYLPAMRNLGTALLNMGRTEESLELFQRAATLDSNSASSFNKLGIAFASMDRMEDADTAFRRAIDLEPTSAKHHGDYAKCLLISADYKRAIRYYRKGIELDPGNPNLHYELGVALAKDGQLAEAIAAYRRTLSINPNDSGARKELDKALQQSAPSD